MDSDLNREIAELTRNTEFVPVQEYLQLPDEKPDAPTPPGKKSARRGRKPARVDVKLKLERSRQSARECRARKKLRYQYLEELVNNRERAIYALRSELETLKKCCIEIDRGQISDKVLRIAQNERSRKAGMIPPPAATMVAPPSTSQTSHTITQNLLQQCPPAAGSSTTCNMFPTG